jgi:hypothetical protein
MKNKLAALILPACLLAATLSHAQKVMPTSTGSGTGIRWTLTLGQSTFLTGPKNGGRIHALRHNGSEILHLDTSSATNYGSTFWPSPQAVWNWPPPANLDGSGAYTASLDADTVIRFVGQVDNTTKLRIRKEYWADLADSTFNMRFWLVNTGTTRQWSPWQDSRNDTGGIYFFPKGDSTVTGDLAQFVKDSVGMKWYAHNANTTLSSGTTKFYADGKEGWYAHVTADRILFLKKFSDSPYSKKAPNPENEIELYTTNKPLNNSDFVEMEVQGSYDTIKTNDSTSWTMKWYVRKLPDALDATLGSQALVTYVRGVMSGITNVSGHAATKTAFAVLSSTNESVRLSLAKAASVSVVVMDARGAVVQRLHNGSLEAGAHSFRLAPAAKGLYWVVLRDARGEALEVRSLPRL